MSKFRNSKGFTLIELMIVVVIIGILAAIAIPKFAAVGDNAKTKEADGILKQVATLEEAFRVQCGDYTAVLALTAGACNDLTDVGFEAPTTLQHYQAPTVTSTAGSGVFTVQMQPLATETSIPGRQFDSSTGDITDIP